MTIRVLKSKFQNALSGLYPLTEINSFFFLLIKERLQLKRVDLALNLQQEISLKDTTYFEDALSRIKKQEPIQYIIGKTEFYNLSFKVDKNVLIPRPETEELVVWILEEVRSLKSEVGSRKIEVNKTLTLNPTPQTLNILDIGTGSGCIAIALAKNLPDAKVWALDISKEALHIAQQNAVLNKVNVNFIEGDILKQNVIATERGTSDKDPLSDKEITRLNESVGQATVATLLRKDVVFNIIVSNPPYVRQKEKTQIKANVLKHEPHLSLFVDDNNPLIFYDKIADFATAHLSKNGSLYFEINQYLGADLVSLLKEKGFNNIELKQDIFGEDRMIKALR